jgi:hypothetical protein
MIDLSMTDRAARSRTQRSNKDGATQRVDFPGQLRALPAVLGISPDFGAEPNRCTMLVDGTALGRIAAILREFSSR